jgi:hypothetical protein
MLIPTTTVFKKKYTSKKPRKKRTYKKKLNFRKALPLADQPDSKMVRLRYVEQISLNPGAGAVASYRFRANDIYDPNWSGTGHKPMGQQQLFTLYDHATVVGSKIKFTPMTHGYAPAGTNSGVYGTYIDDNTTTSYTNAAAILESRLGKSSVLIGNGGSAGTKPRPAIRKFSTSKFFGVKNVVGKDLYRCGATFSPTEDAYFVLWYGSIGGNDPGLLNFMVEIEYICVMTEPKQIAVA